MPLREDLLTPIPGDNPSGKYLYYLPVYDKIKEARREDTDTGPAGVWARTAKVADWNQVIKLAGEAIATQSKDLQLAVWLAEAYFKKEGFPLLRDSIELLRQMVETFWDTLYPELEDGDAEFRATPLSWLGNFDLQIRMAPITRGGLSMVDYKVSLSVGYKADAEQQGDTKLNEYNEKVAEGKVSADAFDADFDKSPKKHFADLYDTLTSCLESLENLQLVCEEKFGDFTPGFSKLRTALEETQNTVRSLLNRKREKEPDAPPAGQEPEPQPEEVVEEVRAVEDYAAAEPVKKAVKKGGPQSAEPSDPEDAIARLQVVAKYLREQEYSSPAPYLMLAGFRFGELRAGGDYIDARRLEPPPSEVRQNLKMAALESNWNEVFLQAERAVGLPCGRGWLDVHRYAARACYEMGSSYDGLRKGIIALVRGILQDYPDLSTMTLMDDTACANAETLSWIGSDVNPPAAAPESAAEAEYVYTPPVNQFAEPAPGGPPDAWELAEQALRSGRVREAVELIDREAKTESSGRGRFLRRSQLARIFADSGNEALALPILEQLAAEIESRGLEDWEPSESLSFPLTLLYRCLARSDREGEVARKLYAKLCRLDPLAAMSVLR